MKLYVKVGLVLLILKAASISLVESSCYSTYYSCGGNYCCPYGYTCAGSLCYKNNINNNYYYYSYSSYSSSSSISGGAIAGIIIGVVILLTCIAACAKTKIKNETRVRRIINPARGIPPRNTTVNTIGNYKNGDPYPPAYSA